MGVDRFHDWMSQFGFGHKTGIDLVNEKSGTLPSVAWKRKRLKAPWYRGEMMSVEDLLQILAIDLIGIIPDDEAVITATNRGEVLVLDKNSKTGKYYMDIARRITGESIKIDPIEDNPSLMERLSGMFQGKR